MVRMPTRAGSPWSPTVVAGGVLLLLLLTKYLWPLVAFDAPFGYDAGIYRYLFVRHADPFPPFSLEGLDPWAREHPLGLFVVTSLLIHLGVPVDWLIGWIWNLMPVLLSVALTLAWTDREDASLLPWVLGTALLSQALFDGFAAMYWKTLVALLWTVIAFRLLERGSRWGIAAGVLAVATHHQTGLLAGLALGSWWLTGFANAKMRPDVPAVRKAFGMCAAIALLGLLAYAPVWRGAVLGHIPLLLQGNGAPPGSFPDPSFYLRITPILLAFGVYGLVRSFAREKGTLWQWAVIWSAVFVIGKLFFFRRFFLQLDVFLLPFAALGMRDCWRRFPTRFARGILLAVLLVQAMLGAKAVMLRGPLVDTPTLATIQRLSGTIPENVFLIGLENESAVILRGWFPYHQVGAPGLFAIGWTYQGWEALLLGTHAERVQMLSTIPRPAKIFVSPFFRSYYGEYAGEFLGDSCFRPTAESMLFDVVCDPLPSAP